MSKAFICANGPSLDLVDPPVDADIFCINRFWGKAPTPHYYSVWDPQILYEQRERIRNYTGCILAGPLVAIPTTAGSVRKVPSVVGFGFSQTGPVYTNRTSTLIIMQVAYQMGYDEITVAGIDQSMSGNKLYFGGNEGSKDRAKKFDEEAKTFSKVFSVLPIDIRRKFKFIGNNPHKWFAEHQRFISELP